MATFIKTGDDDSNVINGITHWTHTDWIFGMGGNDTIFGGQGNDILNGGTGADELHGGPGYDYASYQCSTSGVIVSLASGYGDSGDAEGDTLEGIENLEGSEYNDILDGNDDDNILLGMGGNDILRAGWDDDYLGGGNANDILKGGGGADMLDGGAGTDTASYDMSWEGVNVSLTTNTGSGGEAEGDTLQSVENLTGSIYRDVLEGNNGNNTINGLEGGDTLYGLGGVDTLSGGGGHDLLDGGAMGDNMSGGDGLDIYIVDHLWDMVFEAGGEGTDTVLTSVSWTLNAGADVEYLRTTNQSGTTAINLTGNDAGNIIVGNDGNNILNGGGGVDEMRGRNGDDTYFVDNMSDVVVEAAGQGSDAVRASVSYTLAAGVDIESLSTSWVLGTDAINLTGNSSGNVVTGNNGMNWLNGGAGNDELIGRGGMDYFVFNTALDADFNVDTLSDFDALWDTIVIDDAIFGGLAGGGLAEERFVIGAAAQDGDDRIIYNDATGALMYDSDGTGAAAAIRFAQLDPGTVLNPTDFGVL
jgi:Ca2+-binding RTX toxin-like protein